MWQGPAPGTENRVNAEYLKNERVYKTHQPSLTVHLPPRELATGAAVLILPGGGYDHVTIYKEGHQVAAWLNSLGIAGFVLKYRLDQQEALQDALEAMRLIRKGAEKWHLDTKKVGAIGFSAGGHLTLNLVGHADTSSRPDFLMIMYPAVQKIDLDKSFAKNAGPSLIIGASDDTSTPPENAVRIYQSLVKAKVPVELHLYASGGHGFGLGLYRGPVSDWRHRAEDWFRGLHLLVQLP